jgi:hypothetical protein
MKERLGFLVPGIFGLSSVGAVNFFDDVERALGLAVRLERAFSILPLGLLLGPLEVPLLAIIVVLAAFTSLAMGAIQAHHTRPPPDRLTVDRKS